MKRIFWLGCLCYFLIGLAHVVIGTVLEEMMAYYGRSYGDGGQLIFNQFAGFLVGVLLTPLLTSRIGRRGALLFALAALTIGETVYCFLLPWKWMLTAAPVAGLGFGMIEAIIGAIIIEFMGANKAIAMSRLEVFFGIGALLIPVLSSVFILYDMWYASFISVTVLSIGTGALWLFLPLGEAEPLLRRQSREAGERPAAAAAPPKLGASGWLFIGLMLVFFLAYVGVEMSFVNFLPSMLIENAGVTSATASISITFFWGTMAFGRFFAGVLAERMGYARYLFYSCGLSLLMMAGFVFASQLWSSFAVTLLFGIGMAGIFSIALVFANHVLPGMTERMTSLLVAAGGIGGAIVPRLTGWMMDAFGVSGAQWLLMSFMGLLFLIVIAASRMGRSAAPSASAAVQQT